MTYILCKEVPLTGFPEDEGRTRLEPIQPGDINPLQELLTEVDCRIEHGADSNGHLEYVRDRLWEILYPDRNSGLLPDEEGYGWRSHILGS